MTREEAIEVLLSDRVIYQEWEEAVRVAVKALKELITRGECKTCKYFEYDHVDKLNGIPLILAHEICTKWGDGCKTLETGYCFLYEPKEGGADNEM